MASTSSEQVIVNVILDLLKADTKLKQINWYPLPRLRSQSRRLEPPFGHIYHLSSDEREFATARRFITDTIIAIDILTPVDDPDSQDREIHKLQNLVKNIIRANPSIRNGTSGLPANLSIEQMKYLGADYGIDSFDEMAVDEIILQVEVSYVEVL